MNIDKNHFNKNKKLHIDENNYKQVEGKLLVCLNDNEENLTYIEFNKTINYENNLYCLKSYFTMVFSRGQRIYFDYFEKYLNFNEMFDSIDIVYEVTDNETYKEIIKYLFTLYIDKIK